MCLHLRWWRTSGWAYWIVFSRESSQSMTSWSTSLQWRSQSTSGRSGYGHTGNSEKSRFSFTFGKQRKAQCWRRILKSFQDCWEWGCLPSWFINYGISESIDIYLVIINSNSRHIGRKEVYGCLLDRKQLPALGTVHLFLSPLVQTHWVEVVRRSIGFAGKSVDLLLILKALQTDQTHLITRHHVCLLELRILHELSFKVTQVVHWHLAVSEDAAEEVVHCCTICEFVPDWARKHCNELGNQVKK